MPKSHLEKIIEALKAQPKQQASAYRISQLTGLPFDRVQKVVADADQDPTIDVHIGGSVVKFRGHDSDGLYEDVIRIINTYWGHQELGLRNIRIANTSKRKTGGVGTWSHPDLVIAADPPKRTTRDESPRLHAVEIENQKGFDLRSVYQAHAQGRGANYSWVIGNQYPGVEKDDWDRTLWTAKELGVGLVTFIKSGAFTTWTTHLKAAHKVTTTKERTAFLEAAVGPENRITLGV